MSQQPDHEHAAQQAADNRTESAVPTIRFYTFGPFCIDLAARHLIKYGAVVPVTAKVFDTLLVLVKNHDRAVSKEEVIHAVWPNTFVSDDSLVQNISAIRRALGDDPSEPQYIATLARRGYRFIAPVDGQTGEPGTLTVSPPKDVGRTDQALPAMVEARRPAWITVAAAFVTGIALTALIVPLMRPARATIPAVAPIRFREMLPQGQVMAEQAALSPNGRALAFVTSDANGRRQLWVRPLESDVARPIEGTTGALAPFWSPDSEYIAYFVGIHIKRIAASGGHARPVATLQRSLSLGGTWTSGDRILFCDQGKIFAVSASGGTPAVVVEATPNLAGEFRWPLALPDGRRFLFVVNSDDANQSGTYLGTFGSHDVVRVLRSIDSPAVYAAPGYLLYVREHVLMAQEFDLDRGLKGEPRAIIGDLSDTLDLSAAGGGLLAVSEYAYGARAAWVDRSGQERSSFKVPSLFRTIAISPDNKQALATSADGAHLALWQIDLERSVSTRLVTNAGFPAWAPDGSHFAFIAVGTGGAADLSVRSTVGKDDAVWLKTDDIKVVTDWSVDSRYILFNNNNKRGVWMLPTSGDHTPRPLVQAQGGTASGGRLSPDGRLVAYVSDETGVSEVYVTPFSGSGIKVQVSTGGGSRPVWRGDSRELFYFSGDRHITVVAMPPGGHLAPGNPQPLFAVANAAGPFGVTQDGQRFLLIMRDHSGDRGAITMLTNWTAAQ